MGLSVDCSKRFGEDKFAIDVSLQRLRLFDLMMYKITFIFVLAS